MVWFLFRKKGQVTRQAEALRLFHAVILAAALFFQFVGAGVSSAGEKAEVQPAPATQPAPAATPPPSPETPIEPIETKSTNTADETHEYMQRNILEQVVRFDDFFGNPKTANLRQTRYQIRLRSAIRAEEGENLKFGPSIRANLVLSKINERLRLTISGDNEPPPVTPSLPEDPGNPGFDRTSGNTTKFVNTELRYGLIKSPSMDLFLGAGVRIVLPPEAFVRSRFQYNYHFSDTSLFRFEETLFVITPKGPGTTTELTLERLLDKETLLRWASSGTAARGIQGFEMGSELSLIHELSNQSAITVLGGVYGNTSFYDTVSNYRLLTRYRRDLLRKWVYFELEPEIFWPRTGDRQFPTKFAFTFRLEIVLEGTAAK